MKSKAPFPFHSSDLLPACDGERPTLAFLQDVMNILLQYVVKSFDRSTKVIDFHYPNELLQEYNWELADQPQNLEEILTHCQTTLKYAIKTGIVQQAIIKLFLFCNFHFFSIKSFLFYWVVSLSKFQNCICLKIVIIRVIQKHLVDHVRAVVGYKSEEWQGDESEVVETICH